MLGVLDLKDTVLAIVHDQTPENLIVPQNINILPCMYGGILWQLFFFKAPHSVTVIKILTPGQILELTLTAVSR